MVKLIAYYEKLVVFENDTLNDLEAALYAILYSNYTNLVNVGEICCNFLKDSFSALHRGGGVHSFVLDSCVATINAIDLLRVCVLFDVRVDVVIVTNSGFYELKCLLVELSPCLMSPLSFTLLPAIITFRTLKTCIQVSFT